jgi:DNA-binding CsgD family transcriptional regulator
VTDARISLQDAVDCHRLLGECSELWDDPFEWQSHLITGLERRLGGFGSALKLTRFEAGRPVMETAVLSTRSDDEMRVRFARCVDEGGHQLMPHLDLLGRAVAREGAVTLRYSDAQGGMRSFHRSEFYQRYLRVFGTGDTVVASQAQKDGSVLSLMTLRTRSERAFSDRDASVLGFVGAALAGQVGTRLTTVTQRGAHNLAPRLRQTLRGLLEGDGEKQIAARLRLHPTTVHDYVRAVYRHFGVHSRAELMASAVRPGLSATGKFA